MQIPSTSETNLYFANNMLIAFCVQPPAIFLHSGGKFPSCSISEVLVYSSESLWNMHGNGNALMKILSLTIEFFFKAKVAIVVVSL